MLANKPAFYDTTHKQIAAQGSRVIALAYKWIPTASQQHARNMSRDEAESDLIFAGFLAFHCPVKPDSKGAMELLLQSSHRVRKQGRGTVALAGPTNMALYGGLYVTMRRSL